MDFRGWSDEAGEKAVKAENDPGPVAGVILFLLIGPIIWSAHLLATYGPQSALCAWRVTGEAAVQPWLASAIVGAVTVLSLVSLLLTLWRPVATARLFRAASCLEGDQKSFLLFLMRLLAALSLAGVVWAGATALILDPCAQLR
jgi:hypothetical protein